MVSKQRQNRKDRQKKSIPSPKAWDEERRIWLDYHKESNSYKTKKEIENYASTSTPSK